MIDISLRLAISRVAPPAPEPVLPHIAWDDENIDYNYKCRTQSGSWTGPDNPPAVYRYAPFVLAPSQKIGEYPVNIGVPYDWKPFVIELNGGDEHKFYYWCGKERAQFNKNGWPIFQNVGMSGNKLKGYRVGEWFRFETLKPSDLSRAQGMTRASHPWLIHTFTCVTWAKDPITGEGYTKHIFSTGTPVGTVDYPLITEQGYAFIPWRWVAY